jgi:atlastin
MKHPHGKPENILRFKSDDQFEIENEKLKEIFTHPDVINRKIVAFSVIGAFRRGKSYFLNYCLRYLYANVSNYFILKFINYLFLI